MFAVVNSCQTGQDVFMCQTRSLQRLKSTRVIGGALEWLLQEDVTTDRVAAAREQFSSKMRALNIDPHKVVNAYKHTTTRYRGIPLSFTVNSAMDEFRTDLACELQSLGVETGIAPSVGCENELVDRRDKPGIQTTAECCSESIRARNTASDLLRGAEQSSGPAIVHLFKEHSAVLRGLGMMWNIVYCLFHSCVGEAGDSRLKSLVIAALPAAEKYVSAHAPLVAMDKLSHGKLLQFCGAGAGTIFAKVHAWLRMIASDRVPDIGADSSAFGCEVRMLVANVCVYELLSDHAQRGVTIYGAPAAKAYFDHGCALANGNTSKITVAMLTLVHVFRWLLSEEQSKR